MKYCSYDKLMNLCLFISLAILFDVSACEQQVSCLFIFGDSLVDNGNNNNCNTSAKVDFLPYGIDFPDGPTGRFNNGRNFADIIAEMLGFDKYIPPFVNAKDEDILKGVNYGSGGAGILDETGRVLGDVINLNEQLSNHELVISRIAKLLGSEKQAKQQLRRCIYTLVIGSNDYLNNYFPKYYDSTTPYTPQQFANRLIVHYSKQLQKLYKLGARKVAVFPLGKLGCVPQHRANYGPSDGSACLQTSNDIVLKYNERLRYLIDHLNRYFFDAKFLYTISANNTNENITNTRDPCCKGGSNGQCIPGAFVCSNRDKYYFWDGYHPTEAATLISAKSAYNNMSPLYNDHTPGAAWSIVKNQKMGIGAV